MPSVETQYNIKNLSHEQFHWWNVGTSLWRSLSQLRTYDEVFRILNARHVLTVVLKMSLGLTGMWLLALTKQPCCCWMSCQRFVHYHKRLLQGLTILQFSAFSTTIELSPDDAFCDSWRNADKRSFINSLQPGSQDSTIGHNRGKLHQQKKCG